MRLKFWGVRGSIPSPGPHTVKVGGNTACVEISAAGRTFVIDAGTGIRALGEEILRRGDGVVDILFSHCHFDHIEGLPFFAPIYRPDCRVAMWSGHLNRPGATRGMVSGLIASPYFPVSPAAFGADISYLDFVNGTTLDLADGVTARTMSLNHPGGATGYRIECGGKSVCYISDVEHRPESDADLVDFTRDADVMIYDAMYTDEEYARYRGYGHSTWQEAVKLAEASGARQLYLFHHFPGRGDDDLAAVEKQASARRPGTFLAREGLELTL